MSTEEGLTRFTVNLTPAAATALERAAQRTGDSLTDTANIALMLLDQLIEAGDREGIVRLEAPNLAGRPLYLLSWRQPFVRKTRRWWQLW